ncbi:ectonucleotide pyrophosphatase/phosphodiesterase family member 3-like [Ananas comosus]|uniref:Ectonucleotide pyrophosphatase/phosphodiesterase family member 3-like n=1 Tax=Ananas comosus TaxID=4615 RepID=A0A6P5FR53_ANACO|nr:ectonucleotide pyrophosphatase/phosphodiesterase family member 3-like [Ananas comosus]
MASPSPLLQPPPSSPDPSQHCTIKLPLSFPKKPQTPLFLFVLFLAISSAAAFVFLLSSSSSSASSISPEIHVGSPRARALAKLRRPVVLVVSCDGFRFGYQFKTPTPNIHRLVANGTEAETGLIPVFPSLTFPNHYAIATGLYPASHGIINNYFVDPVSGERFTPSNHDPKWWLGEPLWETVADHGLNAATYFWPGSEVVKGNWTCPPRFCPKYNASVPFEQRVDTVLSYFDLPQNEIPVFINLYFEDPDKQGHQVGPDDPKITKAVVRVDEMIGRLIQGLEERGIFEDVTFILLGDHGMVGTCDKKTIFLDDLAPWIRIPESWVTYYYPVLSILPPTSVSYSEMVAKMNAGLASGKVENGDYLRMYLKEDLPGRLHYSDSSRIPPIVGLVDEGFSVEQARTNNKECAGAHGYDNALFSMRTIFVAHGPQFQRGRKIPSFVNIEIYNLITSILKLKGAPNNGSASFPNSVLLPSA